MPTVREIEQKLYDLAPKELAFPWDNVGQLLGDPEQSVSRVLVTLDPVMNCKWLPVQSVRTDTPQGHLLLKLLLNGVSAICMHTNLDASEGGVNDCLAEALELIDPGPLVWGEERLCRVGTLKEPMPLEEFAKYVCKKLGSNGVRFAGKGGMVSRVAVGGGSCADSQDAAIAVGCDTFVTSDIKYHDFLDAEGKGINLIDAGHFPTEDPVCYKVISYLTEQFPELAVTKSTSHKEVIQYYVEGDQ